MTTPLLALTLWRPWDTAILQLGKPVENRGWAPPLSLVGNRFALHSGQKWDEAAACRIVELCHAARSPSPKVVEAALDRAERVEGAIIGTVRLARVIRRIDPNMRPPHTMGFVGALAESLANDPLQQSPWFVGPFGWVCDEPFVLPEPVPCRGMQKLWQVPQDVAARVLAQEPRQ